MSPAYKINACNNKDYDKLIKVWENAVRNTHHFLSEADISQYRLMIYDYYLDTLKIYSIKEDDKILGFIGLKDDFIQMLFVEPSAMRKGIGKTLICFAITKHGAKTVDVNEQNTNARLFYSKMGFILKERSKSDALGKPYPILSLVLSHTIC